MNRSFYVENGGVLGYANAISGIFQNEINEIMGDNANEFQNKVQAIINHMNKTTLSELLIGHSKTENKTIRRAYIIARNELLKKEIANDLRQRISQSLEQGSNLGEFALKIKSDSGFIEMYGEMTQADKDYIRKCVKDILKNRKETVSKAMNEVKPGTLKNALKPNNKTIEPPYLDEVKAFTNGYKFLCENSDAYAAKTGYRRKFEGFGNYAKFCELRNKLNDIVERLQISESKAISLVLKGVSKEENTYINSLYDSDKALIQEITSQIKQLAESLEKDPDNKYILEQVRNNINLKPSQDNKNSSSEER